MRAALDQARLAAAHGDVPIGAVVVHHRSDGTTESTGLAV